MNRLFIKRVIKFGIVGFIGLLIDFGITYLLKEQAGFNKYLANTTGFIVAASCNYFLNRRWTFRSNNQKILKEYSFFIAISALGLILNNLIIWVLSDYNYSLDFYLSKTIAVLVVFLWNFFMNSLFTFRYSINKGY